MITLKSQCLFTIGYAGYSLDNFIATLKDNNIAAVVDVRAMPDISHFYQYKRNNIRETLSQNNILYKFFGEILGARPTQPKFLTEGKVDFKKIRETDEFQKTCINLHTGLSKGINICLMCAQIDPIICHRSILITDYFRYLFPTTPIFHIHKNRLESQQELDKRVLRLYENNAYETSLLSIGNESNGTLLQKAYSWQGRQIAYAPKVP